MSNQLLENSAQSAKKFISTQFSGALPSLQLDFIPIPWFLVEVKPKIKGISSALFHFQKETLAPHVFQVSFDAPFVNKDCFQEKGPIIVPARTFLSQLV